RSIASRRKRDATDREDCSQLAAEAVGLRDRSPGIDRTFMLAVQIDCELLPDRLAFARDRGLEQIVLNILRQAAPTSRASLSQGPGHRLRSFAGPVRSAVARHPSRPAEGRYQRLVFGPASPL